MSIPHFNYATLKLEPILNSILASVKKDIPVRRITSISNNYKVLSKMAQYTVIAVQYSENPHPNIPLYKDNGDGILVSASLKITKFLSKGKDLYANLLTWN